jgi:D-alanyl-D-alanine carboxypeptidase
VKVRRGKLNQVILTAVEDGRVTVAKGKENSVSALPQLPPSLTAPIQKGQVVAKVLIQNEGKVVKEVGLSSSSDVLKSSFPPWPITAGGIACIVLIVIAGFWLFRRPKRRRVLSP